MQLLFEGAVNPTFQAISKLIDDLRLVLARPPLSLYQAEKTLLITEELLTNLVKYTLPQTPNLELILQLNYQDQWVHLSIEDNGPSFNPLKYELETEKPLAEQRLGGVGLTLIRKNSETMVYTQTAEGKNRIELWI